MKENSGDKVYDFYKLLKRDKEIGEIEDKAMNFFEDVVAPYFWDFFRKEDAKGRHTVKCGNKYIAKLNLNYYDYPETYKYSCCKQLQKIIKNIIFFLLFISEIDIIAVR